MYGLGWDSGHRFMDDGRSLSSQLEQVADLVSRLTTGRSHLKFWHWQTRSYAQHIGLNTTIDKLDKNTDKLAESLNGHYTAACDGEMARPLFAPDAHRLPYKELADAIPDAQDQITVYLRRLDSSCDHAMAALTSAKFADLENIIQDIKGIINRGIFFLSLQ